LPIDTRDASHYQFRKTQPSEAGRAAINTSRGALIDTEAVIEALKAGQLGGLAIDVYEREASLFFPDLSSESLRTTSSSAGSRFPMSS
jgi:lactate dehydrogenase-like 2-hydroxyacid dehydrogenase